MSKAFGSAYGLVADARWSHGVFNADGEEIELPFVGWATEVRVNLDEEETEIVPLFLFNDRETASAHLLAVSEGLQLMRLRPSVMQSAQRIQRRP